MIDKIREIALKALYKIDKEEAYSNIVLNEIIKINRKNLNDRDIGLISELVYGVTSWRLSIDQIIKKYSKIRLKKISPWIVNIIRMGIYQIIFLDKIPKSAAVNESVNLAKKYGHSSSSNFVNAILRKVEKTDFEEFYEIKNDVERISKTTSMPEWIVSKLLEHNKLDTTEKICKNSNIKPKMSIRINTLKISIEEFLKELQTLNIEYKKTNVEEFVILEKIKNIENMQLFKQGYFTIQDISAGLTAKILNPSPNEKVLDACSAPGGKTTYLAELMQNKGSITAWDIHKHRTKLVDTNAKRLGIDIITTEEKDSTIYDKKYIEIFDKILLDVPCLGLGVIKRKPDIKWKRTFEQIEEITNIQKTILESCSKYLKKGGALVYSTCSLLKEENEDIIGKFLQKNKDFSLIEDISIESFLKENYLYKNGCINIVPSQNLDGFFICKMKKN